MPLTKSSQSPFPSLSQLRSSFAPAVQSQLSSNPDTRFVQNADVAHRVGSKDPGWDAVKHELALDIGRMRPALVSGYPYLNEALIGSEKRPPRAVISIGGYGAGEKNRLGGAALSDIPTDFAGIPQQWMAEYRWFDRAAADNAIDLFGKIGVPTMVVGHSYGGSTALDMAGNHPDTPFVAVDPVGGDTTPDVSENAKVYKPDHSALGFPEFLSWVGGRNKVDVATKYSGGHMLGSNVPVMNEYAEWVLGPNHTDPAPVSKANDSHDRRIEDRRAGAGSVSKSGSFVGDWASQELDRAIHWNPPSAGETAGRAAAGAIGASALAYLLHRLSGKKRSLGAGKLALAALLGGAFGTVSSYYDSYMDGKPFDNSNYNPDGIKPGDRVYLGVAGMANGEGASWFADEMRRTMPSGRVKMFNWGDSDDFEKTYADVVARGGVPIIVGHSRGAASAADYLEKHPEAVGYLLDPVRWGGSKHPENALAFTVVPENRHGVVVDNYIADVGGRWNLEDPGTIMHTGSHSHTMPRIIRDFVLKGYDRTNMPEKLPEYVREYRK